MRRFLSLLSVIAPGLCSDVTVDYRDFVKPQLVFVLRSQEQFLSLIFLFKTHTRLLFSWLGDLTAVDCLGSGVHLPFSNKLVRFQLVYSVLSLYFNTRARLVFYITEWASVYSIMSIFRVANWLEREVWDMFGIFFIKHSDLRRILTDYGFEGFPLRKDFPLSGFEENRYDETTKLVAYEGVELAQEMRYFDSLTPWSAFVLNKPF